ncbi:hypothetical protein GCM10010123_31860 [Pilimelia anulata]|uniref:O-antigen ligase like membrane protein n=1 Tax=Pilimelia anulata TaxID=53371 RepID=A0A8J3B6P1_9ACTN|nr:hypothetical protein [Pilimelia anulata]GGJ99577.1 hypothetical protein GCM10010123_31860 [Pilimelia anulata]
MTAPAPAAGPPRAATDPHPTVAGRHAGGLRPLPAWPLVAPLAAFPLWWALGLGVLVFSLAAVPMAYLLLRAHRSGRVLRTPPGFLFWLVFLAAVVIGLAALDADPPGTVPGAIGDRLFGAGYRISQYGVATVVLLYAGNLAEAELPRRRLVQLLGWLFGVTVAGGFLGIVAGHFAFTSPVELLLPAGVRNQPFVQSLVHPYAAQIMDLVGGAAPRPAAPWGYTNTWGNNYCLLVGWFIAAVWGRLGRPGLKLLAAGVLAASIAPVIISLNRGLWIGLAVSAVYVAVRLALRGNLAAFGALAGAVLLAGGLVLATPLGDVLTARLDNGKSNGVRSYLAEKSVEGLLATPIVGYGSTRSTLGGRNSITVGERADCARCGNFTIGGTGQLWQLLYAHGLAGTIGYLGFLGYGLWRFRRDHTAVGLAGSVTLISSLVATLWYNALVTPLIFTFLGYALLWRQHLRGSSA